MGLSSGGSTIPLETQEILDVAEDAECIPGNKSGKQYDSRTDDKTHQTARGGKATRGNASVERTRSKAQDSQTGGGQLKHSLGGGEQRAEGTSQEVDGASTNTDSVFARAWSGELGRELCGMADACGETTMSTLSTGDTSWSEDQVRQCTAGLSWDRLTEQTSMILAEVGAHTGARMYNTMQQVAGTKSAMKLGGAGNHLTDTNTQTTPCQNTGTKKQRHLWLSLRCGSYCKPVQTEHNKLTTAQKQTEREKMGRLQQEYKGALELARSHIGPGGDAHLEWPDQCAAWNLDFIQKGMQELCLNTTTASGCALGVKHLFFR